MRILDNAIADTYAARRRIAPREGGSHVAFGCGELREDANKRATRCSDAPEVYSYRPNTEKIVGDLELPPAKSIPRRIAGLQMQAAMPAQTELTSEVILFEPGIF